MTSLSQHAPVGVADAGGPALPPADSPFPPTPTAAGSWVPDAQTPFQRLPRVVPGFAWWKLLVAVAIGGVVFIAVQVVVLLVALAFAVSSGQLSADLGGMQARPNQLMQLDPTQPVPFLTTLFSIIAMIPGAYVGYRVAGLRPVGLLASVALRMRWRWLVACLVPAVIALAASIGATFGLAALTGEALTPRWTPWPTLLVSVLLIVVFVPLQSAAEEVVFRGVLVQAIGSWLPRRAWSIAVIVVVAVLPFTFGHLYNIWGLLDVAVFATVAVWVTLRTGGLEAAIALHVVNNVMVFLMLASGVMGTTVQASDGGSLVGVLLTAITLIGYACAVEVMARRRGIRRTSVWPETGSTTPPAIAMPVAAAEVPGAYPTPGGGLPGQAPGAR